jgi:SAM-dependent methyltransferase
MTLPFEDMKVLDCGCGEGHIAHEIANRSKSVVGYDIINSPSWANLANTAPAGTLSFTTSKETVASKAPYDCIILYDVIDHLEKEDPIQFLRWLHTLLADDGRIFVRAHPWTAKHGSHLYENGLNKAYVHLALTPDELAQAGVEVKPNLRISRPMAAYENMFKDASLKVYERKGRSDPIEPFFSGPLLERIIKVTWRGSIDQDAALKIMSNCFIDYSLSKMT